MDSSWTLPSPEDGVEDDPKKPLGTYRCAGRCDADGFVKGGDHVPCPKCRVYSVAGASGKASIQIFGRDARYVRGRTALEAMQIFAKVHPTLTRFEARRHNHGHNKKSVSIEYERDGETWKRRLSRPTEERAIGMLHYRIQTALRIAEKTWKVPAEKVAGVVKYQLDEFMKARQLVWKKT